MDKEKTYLYIGEILELIQKWEEIFKKVTIKFGIERSDDKRSLSNMNSFLFKNGIILQEDFNLIKKIIEGRNFVIHRYFLEQSKSELFLESLKKQLNDSINKLEKMIVL